MVFEEVTDDSGVAWLHWSHTEYEIVQLLPADGWVSVFFDEGDRSSSSPITLRTRKPLHVALANTTTRYRRERKSDRQSLAFKSSEYREPLTSQDFVGVDASFEYPVMMVNEVFYNCLGLMRDEWDLMEWAEENMDSDLFARVVRPPAAAVVAE